MDSSLKPVTDSVMREDAQNAAHFLSGLPQLHGSTILVTGATGLIGSAFIRAVLRCNELYSSNINIIALVRNEEKARRVFADNLADSSLSFAAGDILSLPEIAQDIDYIIHGASVTSSRAFVDRPVDTIVTALEGTRNILELAAKKRVRAMLYLSSLEVYGVTDPALPYVSESDYGYIDPLSPRSSYSEGKRMCENLCVSYAKQYSVPVRIARLAQTFGAGVEYDDGRVFAMLARSVIEQKDIVLRTKGDTLRNYCYISDAVTALAAILARGENCMAYNVANRGSAITIRDLAQRLCDNYPDAGIRVVFDIAPDASALGFNPTVVIRLDPSKLEALGWNATVDINGMFDRTIKSFRERM